MLSQIELSAISKTPEDGTEILKILASGSITLLKYLDLSRNDNWFNNACNFNLLWQFIER